MSLYLGNVWTGIFGNTIIGPLIIEETSLGNQVDASDDMIFQEVHFQQDGAPPH